MGGELSAGHSTGTADPQPGVPVTAIEVAGATSVAVEVDVPDGRPRRLAFEVDPYRDAIVSTRALDDLTPFVGTRAIGPKRLHDAVRAFWLATAAGAEFATTPSGAQAPLRRIEMIASLTYELIFAGDVTPVRVDVGADGALAHAYPDLGAGVQRSAVGAAVTALHLLRTRGPGSAEPAPIHARTVEEAAAYIEVALPERQGNIGWGQEARVVLRDRPGEGSVRFDGMYRGLFLGFGVHVPTGDGWPSVEHPYLSFGSGRSTLLDAGQWMSIEGRYGADARARSAELGETDPDDEQYDTILSDLRYADGAAKEVAKFLSDGAEAIPFEVLWTARGRALYRAVPQLFTRASVDECRVAFQHAIEEFIARYGPGSQ
jgi:hypothetical protein